MSWQAGILGDVCSFENGDRGKNYPGKSSITESGVPFVNAGNLVDGQIQETENLSFISPEHFQRLSNGKFSKGDFLFCLRGTLGKFAHVDRNVEGAIASSLIIIRPNSAKLHPAYLKCFLGSALCTQQIDLFKNGAAQPNLSAASLKKFEIPLPPLEEQKRIAGILDQAAELCRLRTRALDKLNTLGQAIFHEMFGDQIKHANAKLIDVVRADDKINYGVVQPGEDELDGVPLLRAGDVLSPNLDPKKFRRVSKAVDAKHKKSRLRGDEILVACVGSIGSVALAHEGLKGVNIARAVARVPVDENIAHRVFIASQLRSQTVQNYFQREIRLVAQPTLNIKQITEAPIFLPSLDAQSKFAARLSAINGGIPSFVESQSNLDALFASLQHRAFRGELGNV